MVAGGNQAGRVDDEAGAVRALAPDGRDARLPLAKELRQRIHGGDRRRGDGDDGVGRGERDERPLAAANGDAARPLVGAPLKRERALGLDLIGAGLGRDLTFAVGPGDDAQRHIGEFAAEAECLLRHGTDLEIRVDDRYREMDEGGALGDGPRGQGEADAQQHRETSEQADGGRHVCHVVWTEAYPVYARDCPTPAPLAD